jgi:hypothetical protein
LSPTSAGEFYRHPNAPSECACSAFFRIVSHLFAGTSVDTWPTAAGTCRLERADFLGGRSLTRSTAPTAGCPWSVDRTGAGTRADTDDRTTAVAAAQDRPCSLVHRRSKNAGKTAICCHNSGRPARLAGGRARSASRCNITGSDLVCTRSGHPKTSWHRAPPKLPPQGPPVVHYLKRKSLPADAAGPALLLPRGAGGRDGWMRAVRGPRRAPPHPPLRGRGNPACGVAPTGRRQEHDGLSRSL